jgi:predicted RNA binding protein with dsRBD fold (UPF0201 family)
MTVDIRYVSKALNKFFPDTEWAIEDGDLENIILVSGPEITATSDEIIQMAETIFNDEIEAEAAKKNALESAKAKLAKMGLTAEEAAAVIGL